MLFKLVSSAIVALGLSATVVSAQSLASIGGPANLPPAGFTGQQFVDGRGCLFLRAGFGAQVNWVPRVGRDRKPLCGFPPTFGAATAAAVAANTVPDAPAVVAAPVVAVAPVLRAPVLRAVAPVVVAAAPVVAAPVRATYAAADLAGPASGQIQCFSTAPKLERVLLRSGGTALVCTTGDGSLTGWRSPIFPRNAGVGAALSAQDLAGATLVGTIRTATNTRPATVARAVVPKPPAGYKLAWTDDRLNPLRGQGTAQGQAQQDQVWTRDIPAELVADQPQPRATVARAARVTVSTMSAPQTQQPAAAAASYVQVGTFGQVANADAVKARLAALGLPVSTSKITRSGKVLQIVYAGPFGSTAAAQAALAQTRSAGFGDAILR